MKEVWAWLIEGGLILEALGRWLYKLFSLLPEGLFKFLFHISPALVTVIVGGLVVQTFFVRRANEAAFVDLLIGDLNLLLGDALEYWNSNPKALSSTTRAYGRLRILEQKLIGNIQTISAELSNYSTRYKKAAKFRRELDRAVTDLADACTGGDFQSAERTADSRRYQKVVTAVNAVKTILRAQKL